jgi:hypothetical protein
MALTLFSSPATPQVRSQFDVSSGRGKPRDVAVPSAAMAAFVAIALSACAATRAAGPPPVDHVCAAAGRCEVKIGVTCSQTACTVGVPFQNVDANGQVVVWIIDRDDGRHRFDPARGIAFKSAAGRAAFRCQPVGSDGRRFQCEGNHDRNAYEYGITVVGTPANATLDPWIVNK